MNYDEMKQPIDELMDKLEHHRFTINKDSTVQVIKEYVDNYLLLVERDYDKKMRDHADNSDYQYADRMKLARDITTSTRCQIIADIDMMLKPKGATS